MGDDITDAEYISASADVMADAAESDDPSFDEAILYDLSASLTREDWAWLDIVRGLVRCPLHGQHCSLAEAVRTANENVPGVSR